MMILSLFVFLSAAGCASYTLPPLTADHPAHPNAPVARQQQLSKTLAYTASDLPSPTPVPAVAAAQESDHEAHHETQPLAAQTVTGEGKIIATVPNTNQVVIEHGPIKGFMDAMTMGYQVDSPMLLQGLNSGDRVRFTIDVKRKTIVKMEKVQS
jgi:Cu/Ag efflux protein CusF